jgi:hypothetical protein
MAGQSLDDFAKNMKSFARPNLFEVEITPIGEGNNVLIKRLMFNCHTCSLPGTTILTTEKDMPQAGYNSIAYQKTYEDVEMQFYVHEDMKEIEIFQNWMKRMINPATNQVGLFEHYVSPAIRIRNLDRQQNTIAITTLYEAFPKTLAAIPLAYGTNDEVMSVSITFTYRYYEQQFGLGVEVKEQGDTTETSSEDIPDPLSSINTLKDKTGNLVKKNAVGLFVPNEHRIPIPDRFK